MKLSLFMAVLFLVPQIPRNDPSGVWESESGSNFQLRLAGSDLNVQMVEGSNPLYLKYELTLKSAEEVNTYKGNGYMIAKLQNGKECRFDIDWQVVVVSPDRILGTAAAITPDPETCDVRERAKVQLDLKRKK